MSTQKIHIIEIGEGLKTVDFKEGMTLGALMSNRRTNKSVTVKVNNQRKDNSYVMQPGDKVQLVPNVEAGL
jgi:hypothetical protein